MHRRNLIKQLTDYARRCPEEAATAEQFLEFVEGHEDCFERSCIPGHVTGSAWLVDPTRTALLMTHHKKLDMWLQLGGHSDGDPDTQAVALREAEEESGLAVMALSEQILDVDIHEIPARGQEPAHLHYDVRFALVARNRNFTVSDESNALAWVPIDGLETYTTETSILRMREKWVSASIGGETPL